MILRMVRSAGGALQHSRNASSAPPMTGAMAGLSMAQIA